MRSLRTAQALYNAVVARYSSPATAALGRLLLPYLFPKLSAFATVEDLVSHLRASDTRYRATVSAEFLDTNPPLMYITLYFIVTRLPDSLRSVRDHFLSIDPTSLTVEARRVERAVSPAPGAADSPVPGAADALAPRAAVAMPGSGGTLSVRKLGTPGVTQATEAALCSVWQPTRLPTTTAGAKNVSAGTSTPRPPTPSVPLMKLLGRRGLTGTRLLLALATTKASTLRSCTSTSTTAAATTTTAAAASTTSAAASTAPTAATEAPTPGTTPTSTATPLASSTASTAAPSTTLAPLDLAVAAPPTRGRRSSDLLSTNKVESSSRSKNNRGAQPASVDRVMSVTSCWSLTTTRVTPQSSPCAARVRGGEFSSNLVRAFCPAEGILQTFTLPASPQQNGIAERHIGMVMDVARTSMIHAAAPHFMWPFEFQYAAHQINLQPRVSLPETTPTLRWTGKVGDASAFCVWGSRAFVRDTSADKLSSRSVPCVFLGLPPDAPGWQFYHPTSRRVLSSQNVTLDESVSYYHPAEPVKVAVDSGAARGAEPAGAGTVGAKPERVEPGGAESGLAECSRCPVTAGAPLSTAAS
ncbi:unnamed protein product [Closterium sp. NIES-53]